jgi:hypothetical protein
MSADCPLARSCPALWLKSSRVAKLSAGHHPPDIVRQLSEKRRILMWVMGALGVLVVLFGVYTFLEAHNKYSELNGVIERLGPPTDPNDPSNMAFALMMRDRDKAETRRWQGIMFLGVGLVGLGLAYLISPPGQDKPSPEAADSLPPSDTPLV